MLRISIRNYLQVTIRFLDINFKTPTVAVNENENLNFYQAKQTSASKFGNCKLCIVIASVTVSFICPRCRNSQLRFSTITWQWNHLETPTVAVNENENLNFYQAKQTSASKFGNCKLCIVIASVTVSFICPRCRNSQLGFSTITWQWNHANGKRQLYSLHLTKKFRRMTKNFSTTQTFLKFSPRIFIHLNLGLEFTLFSVKQFIFWKFITVIGFQSNATVLMKRQS